MPPILQSRLPSLAYSLEESVSCRLADLDPGESQCFPIGIASLHQCYQMSLSITLVFFVFHLFPFLVLFCHSVSSGEESTVVPSLKEAI
jgi:hypothetical protein